jgi:hypothetical protein
MKNFIKDTWVLGLALIIGGILVLRSSGVETPETPIANETEIKTETKKEELLVVKDAQKKKAPIEKKASIPNKIPNSIPSTSPSAKPDSAPGFIERAKNFIIPEKKQADNDIIADKEVKKEILVKKETVKKFTPKAPVVKKAVYVAPAIKKEVAEVIVSEVITEEVIIEKEKEIMPEYLLPTPVYFDIPESDSISL